MKIEGKTLNQVASALLRRAAYKGGHSQTSVHGAWKGSIQIFRDGKLLYDNTFEMTNQSGSGYIASGYRQSL